MLWRAPVTLNPLYSSSGNEQQLERAMFGALVKMSDALIPTPDLCETIENNPDGTQYTFVLKEGLAFTDGTPLTSADVIFTLERAINPATGSIWKGRLANIAGAADYDGASGKSKDWSRSTIGRSRSIWPVRTESSWSICAASRVWVSCRITSSVRFRLTSSKSTSSHSIRPSLAVRSISSQYQTDQFLEMARSETFPGQAGLDRIFLPILTPEVGLAQLETGEIDHHGLAGRRARPNHRSEGVTVAAMPSPSMDFLALNLNREYLQNLDMRKAMAHAIDRKESSIPFFWVKAEVTNSPIFGPEWMGMPEGLELYPYDPELATSLLDGSGVDKSQEISIMIIPGESAAKDAALAIMQEQLNQVGFNISILQVDVAELIRRYIDENDFDILYNAGGVFRADPSISGNYFDTATFTPSGGNGSHYSNARVDELLAQGRSQTDLDERKTTYTEIAQILNVDLPWIYLWSPNSLYGFRNTCRASCRPATRTTSCGTPRPGRLRSKQSLAS